MKYALAGTLIIALICAAIGLGITSLAGNRGAEIRIAQANERAERERAKQEQAKQAVEEARSRAEIAETVANSAEKLALIKALADENKANGDALRMIATERVRRRQTTYIVFLAFCAAVVVVFMRRAYLKVA